jgi:hypothetical protein
MEQLNTLVQDAKTLLKAAQRHEIAPHQDGIDSALIAALATAIEMALASDTTQRNAIRDTSRLTETQDRAAERSLELIRKLRYAAKGRFKGEDEQTLKEFRVGDKPARAVKELITELAYMRGKAEKYAGELAPCGFKAADLSALTAAAAELERADSSQELAKKAQKNATEARNNAVKALQLAMSKVRNSAKSVFAGKKDVLREFETITRAKSSKPKGPSADAGS